MLTSTELDQFERDGYVIVQRVLNPESDLDPILHEYEGVLDRLVRRLLAAGKLRAAYQGMPFGQRLIRVMQATGESHSQHFDFSLPKGGVAANTPIWLGEAVFAALIHERLLDCVESVIGPEIYSNPVQHVRLKPPESRLPRDSTGKSVTVGETPWHQDNGVLTVDADETQMLTVWFPLIDATIENGCLIVLPGSHRSELLPHCSDSHAQLAIPNQLINVENAIPLPVRRGDVLLFHRKLQHASLPNNSNELRCSFDLRYHPIGQPTGRVVFPGFVARSRSNSKTELRSQEQWEQLWLRARQQMSDPEFVNESFDRWASDDPLCA